MASPWTRRAILVEAGLVASGLAFVAWLLAGLVDAAVLGAVAGSIAGGGFAGILASRYRDTVLIALVAATPPMIVDLLLLPPSRFHLGGLVRILAAMGILGLVALGLISAVIGVWAQPRLDRRAIGGRSATTVFTIVAGMAVLGWVWFAASWRER